MRFPINHGACRLVQRAVRRAFPDAVVIVTPGEYFVELLVLHAWYSGDGYRRDELDAAVGRDTLARLLHAAEISTLHLLTPAEFTARLHARHYHGDGSRCRNKLRKFAKRVARLRFNRVVRTAHDPTSKALSEESWASHHAGSS